MDNLSPLIIILYLFIFSVGINPLKNREKSFSSEELALE